MYQPPSTADAEPATTAGTATNAEASTSESNTSSLFRPVTPPVDKIRASFGPPPPTYDSHLAESPTEEDGVGVGSARAGDGDVVVNVSMAQTSHKQRSRKSSTVSTTSIRTSRSTIGKGTSTWRPGAPFLSSTSSAAVCTAVVDVNVSAAGSISGVDQNGSEAAVKDTIASHVRSRTVPASATHLLSPTHHPMASTSSAAPSLEPNQTSTSINSLAVPSSSTSTSTSSSPATLRLSPSISRLRSIASNNARRRDSVSASSPTKATVSLSPTNPTASSSSTKASPPPSPVSSTATLVDLHANSVKGVEMRGAGLAGVVVTTSVAEGRRVEGKGKGKEKGKERARDDEGDQATHTSKEKENGKEPFQSRIPTPDRKRTTSMKLQARSKMINVNLKALPVAESVKISKMGEMVGGEGMGKGAGEVTAAATSTSTSKNQHTPTPIPKSQPQPVSKSPPILRGRSSSAHKRIPSKPTPSTFDSAKETQTPPLLETWKKPVDVYEEAKRKAEEAEEAMRKAKEREERKAKEREEREARGEEGESMRGPSPTGATCGDDVGPYSRIPQGRYSTLPLPRKSVGSPMPTVTKTAQPVTTKSANPTTTKSTQPTPIKSPQPTPTKSSQPTPTKSTQPTPTKSHIPVTTSSGKKDWFSSLTRKGGKGVASVGVAMVQSESEVSSSSSSGVGVGDKDNKGVGEERDAVKILEEINALANKVVDHDEEEEDDEPNPFVLAPPVEINLVPATPQMEIGGPSFADANSSSVSLPLPELKSEEKNMGMNSLASYSSPSLPLDASDSLHPERATTTSQSLSTPPSPTRSSPRMISPRTPPPKKKSKSWFSSPLSGSPLGVSVFTLSRDDVDTSTAEEGETGPPQYIHPPSINESPPLVVDENAPPTYTHPPPPPPREISNSPPPTRSDSLPSLDSVVPSLPATPPASAASTEGAPLLHRKSSGASLNASYGRFGLGFGLPGLLGLSREKSREREREVREKQREVKEKGKQEIGSVVEGVVEGMVETTSAGVIMERTESEDTAVPVEVEVDRDATVRGRIGKSDKARGKEREVVGERSTSRASNNGNGNGWWGIVGWTSTAVAGPDDKQGDGDGKDVVQQDGQGESGDEEEGGGTIKGVPPVVDVELKQVEQVEEVETKEGEVEKKELTITVTPDDGTDNGVVVGSAAWFARWTWYGESGKIEEAKKDEAAKEGQAIVVEETSTPEEVQPETQEVAVVLSSSPPASPSPALDPPKVDENPLSGTMNTAAQRSIWSSLINSTYAMAVGKGEAVKAIEDGRAVERDEHGAEVMEVDFDEEPTAEKTPSTLKEPERKSRGWAGPMRMMVSAVSSSTSRDASVERRQPPGPSSQNGNSTDITGSSATTITTTSTTTMSDDTGKPRDNNTTSPPPTPASSSLTTTITALTKRTASPSPSTTSSTGPSSSKPNGPPPPNLVLPTWEDTFFVPPRSYVDPPPVPSPHAPNPGEDGILGKGLIGGAFRLVSGVLGSPQHPQSASSSSSRRRSNSQPPSPIVHEPFNPFKHYGRELPKAYQVLEEAGWDTSAPPDYAPSPAYSNLASPPPFSSHSMASPRSPLSPRSPPPPPPTSPPPTAASGFSFFGGGPKRAASPPPDMPEPAKLEEVRDVLRGCKRVVVIGVHGWFPGSMIRTVLGEPTGTSSKFANMMALALHQFELEMDVKFEKVTKVVLEGEGEVKRRVDKLYSTLLAHPTHLNDIHRADAILVATHSQGSVVSTHILNKLITDGHIVTRQSLATQMFGESAGTLEEDRKGEVLGMGGEVYPGPVSGLPSTSSAEEKGKKKKPDGLPLVDVNDVEVPPISARTTSTASAFDESVPRKPQRVCCLAMCGIHLGPLKYLNASGFVAPYIQYLESNAARELFEFQSTESEVSKAYVKALERVLDAGVKMVYVASLNDQVVPIYSGLFTAVHHPSILRALYIDGDAYSTSDFLCALLVLLIRIINAGLPDSGLIAHLSEATAGSLSGVGHSTAYEELATYVLAVKYLFLVDEGAMGNINGGSSDIHLVSSTPSHSPSFISPTFNSFSAFSPFPHSPSPISSPTSSPSPLQLPPPTKPKMQFTPFSAHTEKNDYEIPWSLRDLIAHPIISYLFGRDIEELRDRFGEWNPKTAVLRDVKRKVSPIARLNLSGQGHHYGSGGMSVYAGQFGMGGVGGSKL